MAEIRMESGLVGERARLLDDPRDKQQAAASDKPRDELAALTEWVMTRVRQWRDHRRQNYELMWDQYERAWRALWTPEDKNRKSERSTIVTPALGEAVDNVVSEIEEACWGRGDIFELKAELADSPELRLITDRNKAYLKEDLDRCDFRGHMGEALVNGAVYGTGLGEIFVKRFKLREIVSSIQAMQPGVTPTMQVRVKEVMYAELQSVNPRNFLIDPTARSIDTALGCAVEEYVGAHIIRQGQKSGDYRQVEIGTSAGDSEILSDRQVENEYVHDKVHILRYYGLVPEHLLLPPEQVVNLFPGEGAADAESEQEIVEELMPPAEDAETAVSGQKSTDPIDSDMVEALVFIANDGICIKAVKTPYLMEDRPLVGFPWDIVPGRFWGRGICEKGLVTQKMLDAEMRARLDALAYTSAPMMAMDASKLPRGFQLTVRPGKSILTNGDPKNILNPMHFGQLDASTFQNSQQLDQMVQRATGSLDVISLAQRAGGDARPGAVSMMLSGIVKRHKRTLMNFLDKFYVPVLRKLMWRNMQFYPERYTPLNWSFNVSGTMGILQREYETQQLTSLLQTMDPASKEHKLLLMAIVSNTGLTNREEIIEMLKQSISNAAAMEDAQTQQQIDPAQQQLQSATLQYQIAELAAKTRELNARAGLQEAKTQTEMMEPQFRQVELATKGIYQVQENRQAAEFDRRMAVVDRAIEMEDIQSNERIAKIQSGGKVKSEAFKSASALASERVRAQAERAKSRDGVRQEKVRSFGSLMGEHAKAKAQEPKVMPVPVPVPVAPRPIVGSQAQVLG